MNPPAHVRLSVALIILSLVPSLIGFVVNRVLPGRLDADFASAAVVDAVIYTFWIWIAVKTWQGRTWARTLQMVLLPVGLAGLVISIIRNDYAVEWVDPIPFLATAGALVLLWVPASRRYFADTRAALQPPKPVEPYLDPRNR